MAIKERVMTTTERVIAAYERIAAVDRPEVVDPPASS